MFIFNKISNGLKSFKLLAFSVFSKLLPYYSDDIIYVNKNINNVLLSDKYKTHQTDNSSDKLDINITIISSEIY